MTITEFKDGIAQIQAALQGEFPQPFLAFIWSKFKDVQSSTWKLATELICRVDKQARQVVAADFHRCMAQARDEEHRRGKARRSQSATEPVSFERLMELWERSSNPMLKRLAAENRKRKAVQ